MNHPCQCPCGESKFILAATPMLRFICHCKICQSVYRKPYADVTILLAGDVDLLGSTSIEFQRYRLPPALQRGACTSCESPVIGFLRLMPFLRLAFIPSINYPGEFVLPEPSIHIFYNSRLSDIDDDIPKYNGYLRSQLALSYHIMTAFMHKPT